MPVKRVFLIGKKIKLYGEKSVFCAGRKPE